MIVRILGEGQYDLDDHALDALNGLDTQIERGDRVRRRGDVPHRARRACWPPCAPAAPTTTSDSLDESDLILPPPDATIDEVRELLGDDGLIPG